MTTDPVHGALTYGNTSNPHALTEIDGQTWTYDANGNAISTGDSTLTWTYRDELSNSSDGTSTTNYLYDQNGTRRYKANSGNKTYYARDYIENSDGSKEWHISSLGNPVFMQAEAADSTQTNNWIHTDHLGSIAVMTDSSGAWTSARDYYPFGNERVNETQGTGSDDRFDYTGKERDEESGLMYFEARYLATDSGRFMSHDPVAQTFASAILLTDPQSQNAYSYSRNNPINLYDPDGEFWDSVLDVGTAAYDIGRAVYYEGKAIASFVTGDLDAAAQYTDQSFSAQGDVLIDVGSVFIPFVAAPVVKTAAGMVDNIIKETIEGAGDITSKYNPNANEMLDAGEKFLGGQYKELGETGSGVFRSTIDETRQFRIDDSSLNGLHYPNEPHGHLEIIENNKATTTNHVKYTE